MKKLTMVLLLFVSMALIWAGGSQETEDSVKPETAVEDLSAAGGVITLYTSVPQTIIDNIKIDFQTEYPEITLEIFRSGTSKVLAKLMAEKEAGNIAADLVWLADFSVFENLKSYNMLMSYDSPNKEILSPEYYDSEGYYYGSRMMFLVLAYNTELVGPDNIPTSWKDLLKPEYSGKVGSSSPERSGAFMVAAGTIAQNNDMGWEYFEKLNEQGNVISSNSGIAKKIAGRELTMGFALDYTVRKMKKDGSPIDFVYPAEGAIMTPSPIGIMSSTDNSAAAKVFLNYTLSKNGQQALANNGFLPLHPDAEFTYEDISIKDINCMKTTNYVWIRNNSLEIVERFVSIFE